MEFKCHEIFLLVLCNICTPRSRVGYLRQGCLCYYATEIRGVVKYCMKQNQLNRFRFLLGNVNYLKNVGKSALWEKKRLDNKTRAWNMVHFKRNLFPLVFSSLAPFFHSPTNLFEMLKAKQVGKLQLITLCYLTIWQ